MNELTWQRNIIKSVRNQHGHGRKWATQLTVGVPDLILSLPAIGPFLMEVKLFKEPTRRFNRAVGVTPKQRHELSLFTKSSTLSVVGIVLYWGRGDATLVVAPHSIDKLSHSDCGPKFPATTWGPKGFDVTGVINEFIRRGLHA